MGIPMNTTTVKGGEINVETIDRIRTMVSYEVSVEEIVETIPETPVVSSRWVAFVARSIRDGVI